MTEENDSRTESSVGHELAGGAYLDRHFESFKPEYKAMLDWAGIEAGWHILDAGAGGGAFLPWICEQVGGQGEVDAFDLAPENVAMINERLTSLAGLCKINKAKVGSVVDMPYESGQFDMVWSANVTQYLTLEELQKMMSEIYRILKPGGIVVTKEFDMSGMHQWAPLDPAIFWRLLQAGRSVTQVDGVIRTPNLNIWHRKAGFEVVDMKSFSGERFAPLRPVEEAYFKDSAPLFTQFAHSLGLPEEDLQQWDRLLESSDEYILNSPDFYWRESHMMIKGQKPS